MTDLIAALRDELLHTGTAADDLEAAWQATARDKQLEPDGDWDRWLIRAGRGFGKTRTGSEWTRKKALAHPGCRIAVVARTFTDARDVCIEGESGLLAVVPPELVKTWNRSLGEMIFTNSSRVKLFSAEKPDSLRGPQHHWAWCDELAAWDYPETWDQLMFGLRLGDHPKVVVTTTPRPTPIIKQLLTMTGTVDTTGSTFENEANLAGPALQQLLARYEGTRLGRQELYGEILEDVEGALWTRQTIEDSIVAQAPVLKRVAIGVDPSGGHAETGIVVCGEGRDGKGYVLADLTCSGSPDEWARIIGDAVDAWQADVVVAERNFGGDMVATTLRAYRPNLPLKVVTASKGKIPRAEPIAMLFEQQRVHLVGRHPKLEDQLCTYTPLDKVSPDRMDAMVWALLELMVGPRSFDPSKMAPVSMEKASYFRSGA
jgi:phage terminase large subunit-like protein